MNKLESEEDVPDFIKSNTRSLWFWCSMFVVMCVAGFVLSWQSAVGNIEFFPSQSGVRGYLLEITPGMLLMILSVIGITSQQKRVDRIGVKINEYLRHRNQPTIKDWKKGIQ